MTTPWYPSANPSGEHTWLMRNALKEWLDAQAIPGVGSIQLTLQSVNYFDEHTGSGDACMLLINFPDETEGRGAYTGPDDPGGKDIEYTTEIHIRHRGLNEDDWEASQRSYDAVKDGIKDALRGKGRDLGRPDVILQVGEWPRTAGIVHRMQDPVSADGCTDRWGVVTFTITQYLPTFVPSNPAA